LDLYIGLESAASEINGYEPELVPGLFQTADYVRTIIATYLPELGPEEIERRVALRMARQTLITRVTARPALVAVVNEAVLHRPVGGPRVMRDQLRRLLELEELPNVSVRVVPFAIGLHRGVSSSRFTLLRFPVNSAGRESEPPVVYIEGITGALYLDKPHEVERHDAALSRILREVNDPDGATSQGLLRAAIRRFER
jgi:hypothetical protein